MSYYKEVLIPVRRTRRNYHATRDHEAKVLDLLRDLTFQYRKCVFGCLGKLPRDVSLYILTFVDERDMNPMMHLWEDDAYCFRVERRRRTVRFR